MEHQSKWLNAQMKMGRRGAGAVLFTKESEGTDTGRETSGYAPLRAVSATKSKSSAFSGCSHKDFYSFIIEKSRGRSLKVCLSGALCREVPMLLLRLFSVPAPLPRFGALVAS